MGPIEPAAITAAALLATKALESLGAKTGETTWAGLARLLELVRRKVGGDRQGEAALAELEQHPSDQDRIRRLAEVLTSFGAFDEGFHRKLVALVTEARDDPVIGSLATQVYSQALVGHLHIDRAGDIYFQASPPLAAPTPLDVRGAQEYWPAGGRVISNLPARNLVFTGRDHELAMLAQRFTPGPATGVVQPVALYGLGGVGKTQLALEYAYRHAPAYDVRWWVAAQQPAAIPGQLLNLARRLGVPDLADQAEILAMLADALRQRARWLLVFDNAQHAQDLRPYLPSGRGQVLITTRNPSWGTLATPVQVEVLGRPDAVAFLGRLIIVEPEEGTALAEALGDLPLALEQAAAYLEETATTAADYLELLRDRSPELFALGRPASSEETIGTTWTVSIERLKTEAPTALDLLALCAFLGADDLPRSLITGHPDALPTSLASAVQDQLGIHQALAALRRYSLITLTSDAVSMHRLVQRVVRQHLSPAQQQEWVTTAVQLMVVALPEEARDIEASPAIGRLLTHALTAADHASVLGINRRDTATLLHRAGHYLRQAAEHEQARLLHERALAIREAELGPEHPDVASSLSSLARVLRDLGELHTARPLLERALAIHERQRGPEHPDTARSLTNLARLIHSQGDFRTARRLHERALAIFEANLDADHPDIAWSMTGLAAVLRGQGELDRARMLLEQVLVVREAHYGPDHSAVAWSLTNLARVLHNQGDLDAARGLHKRALTIFEANLGTDHPTVAYSLNNLGRALYAQGDVDGARRLHERSLAIRQARLGPDHPDTAWSFNNLGVIQRDVGDLEGARSIHQRALDIRQARLGPDHPDTAYSLMNLGKVLRDEGDLDQARQLLQRALTIFEAEGGPDSVNTAWVLHDLAGVLQRDGDLNGARRLYERALLFRRSSLGASHPQTVRTEQALSGILDRISTRRDDSHAT
jgi:tetratricopeptide (TPR) repeat protein